MDSHIEEMERLLNINSSGKWIIGILGMGGIGKTTIAKVIYNQVCELFECHCFLEDVRENSNSNAIVKLQNKLVSEILKRESKFDNVDQGIDKIKDAIHGKKVLIVLDDVDEKFQIDMLAGNHSWYEVGSRIIITTRNEEVLLALETTCQNDALHELYKCYKPKLMDDDLALQLFSKYAFSGDSPPEGYNALAMEVVSSAGGLPLVLVTLGSLLLIEKNKVLWQEKLRKLKAMTPEEVLGRLRISYDALDNAEKQIFLDIACLLCGEDKTYPCYMWDDCQFYPWVGINALARRSLITVGDDNSLWMHDQLRELGEQIIREENCNELRHLGTKNIKLLRLQSPSDLEEFRDFDEPRRRLGGQEFRNLPNLRYLRVVAIDLDGDFKNLLQNLRWLQWWYLPGKCAPTNLHLKNLVVLHIYLSVMKDDWGCWSQIKMSNKLKVLIVSYCPKLTRIPHLSAFPTLERLEMVSCVSVCRLDGLEELESLKYLKASHCNSLESLPDLSKLTSLHTLDVTFCQDLTEIQGLDRLASLEHLDIGGCVSLKSLPDLSNLEKLTRFKSLRCRKLVEIQGLDKMASLEHLDISGCKSLKRLPNLSNLKKLRKLVISSCDKLIEIQGLHGLESVEHLDMHECKSIEDLPDFSNLTNLRELNVSYCGKLAELRGLEELKFLTELRVVGCKSLQNLPYLPDTTIILGSIPWL